MKKFVKIFITTCFLMSFTVNTNDTINLNRGYLFSFEGIDGSGKTTVMNLVAEKLRTLELPVITTREPGATELGKTLRNLLLHKTAPTCTLAQFLLFAADRAQHFHELIMPKLAEKYIVLSDRMADSAMVYQGYVGGLNKLMIETINKWAMQQRQPDIVFYLKVSAETAMSRISQRQEASVAFEKEILHKKQQIIDGFDTIFINRKNVVIIDSSSSETSHENAMIIDPSFTAEQIADIIINVIISYITTLEQYLQNDTSH